jgi:hypothetical protein
MSIYQCGAVCLLVMAVWAAIRRVRNRSGPTPEQRGSSKGSGTATVPTGFAHGAPPERPMAEVTARPRRRRRRCHYDRFYHDLIRDL